MIVLDTHVWFWWVSGQHQRLSTGLLETLATAPRIGISAVSASADGQFPAYLELAGRLLA